MKSIRKSKLFTAAIACFTVLVSHSPPVYASTVPSSVLVSHAEPTGDPASSGAECIDQFMQKLGISYDMNIDSRLLTEILYDDMLLGDLPSLYEYLQEKIGSDAGVRSFRPMFEQLKTSILTKHPAMLEFLCTVTRKNLLPNVKDEDKIVINRVLHHTYLLEQITVGMARSAQLMNDVENHFKQKREQLGFRNLKDIAVGGGIPLFIKMVSVTAGSGKFPSLREQGYFTKAQSSELNAILSTNIVEASVGEAARLYPFNALAGKTLATHPFKSAKVTGPEHKLEFEVSQEWASLYESWNFAFLVGNAYHTHIFFPKLLIPSVLDAAPNDYLFNRVLSLSATINFILFDIAKGRPYHHLSFGRRLANIWGEINYRYSKRL